jgi:hypothetical protein
VNDYNKRRKKNQEYQVPGKSLEIEIFEYLHDSSIKCADFYSEGIEDRIYGHETSKLFFTISL